jgi:hypothetical protein
MLSFYYFLDVRKGGHIIGEFVLRKVAHVASFGLLAFLFDFA